MDRKLIPTVQPGNGYTHVKLQGVLDENNLLSDILEKIQGRLLLIDMAEVERINSCGVRDWVNWLNQIQALGIKVILLRCSPAVVSQANMVTNFAADAFIHSFYAPYVHPDTGDEQSVLLFTEDIRQNLPIRAPKIFNDAGDELEFDEFEESYFAFINDPRILKYQIPADIQSVIQYYMPEAISRQPVVGVRPQSPVMSQPMNSAYNNAPGYSSMANSGYGGTANPAYGASSYSQVQNIAPQAQQRPYSKPSMQAAYGGIPAPQPNGYPYGNAQAVQNPAVVPMPAPSMLRHEQPPLPGNENAQQFMSRQSPMSPSALPPRQMPSPGQMSAAGMGGSMPPSQMSAVQNNFQSQGQTPVAQSAQFRNSVPVQAASSSAQVPADVYASQSPMTASPEDPSNTAGGIPAQSAAPASAGMPQSKMQTVSFSENAVSSMDVVRNDRKRRLIVVVGAVIIVILLLVLVLIVLLK